MPNPRRLVALLALVLAAGCATNLPVIKFTDIQSRREYRSIGSPTILASGAVNFRDETTGKGVMLQSWEATDDDGRYYTTRKSVWDGRMELVPIDPKKDAPKKP